MTEYAISDKFMDIYGEFNRLRTSNISPVRFISLVELRSCLNLEGDPAQRLGSTMEALLTLEFNARGIEIVGLRTVDKYPALLFPKEMLERIQKLLHVLGDRMILTHNVESLQTLDNALKSLFPS